MDIVQSVLDEMISEVVRLHEVQQKVAGFVSEIVKKSQKPLDLIQPRASINYLKHQETGIRWMLDREAEKAVVCRGGILGDDMGLGKTFQTIGLLKNSPWTYKTLILCPPALMSGWTQELRDCGYKVATSLDESSNEVVTLATYNRAHLYKRDYTAARFERVILDEGHIIRNGKGTQRWWSCMAIASKAKCRWILSATPVQNGEKDWVNLCWWLHVRAGPSTIPTLAPTIMLRRTMEDLRLTADLPPAPVFHRNNLTIPAESAEGKLFRALTDQLGTIMDSQHVSALLKLELYMRIQQFLVHPQLYIESMRAKFKGAYPRPDWTGTATKFDTFTKVLQSSDVPTIVFCNFRAEMDRVADLARSLGRSVWSIRGGMGSDAVGLAVKEARAAALSDASVVIIVQIVAGGAGLNLQFCNRILFLSQHWNPAVVHQACGRAIRIGQRSPVQVHFFSVVDEVADNIDRRMLERHQMKVATAREICSSLYNGGSW